MAHPEKDKLAPPQHIAIIMDGNGRWAKTKGMPREYGHTVGARVFSDITEYCGDIGIDTVTVYAFSTENWKRPKREVDAIMKLFGDYIKKAADTMMKRNIRIIFLGSKAPFSEKVQRDMEEIEEKSKNNARTLNIAINYGGRNELVHAVNEAIASAQEDGSLDRFITEASDLAPVASSEPVTK